MSHDLRVPAYLLMCAQDSNDHAHSSVEVTSLLRQLRGQCISMVGGATLLG